MKFITFIHSEDGPQNIKSIKSSYLISNDLITISHLFNTLDRFSEPEDLLSGFQVDHPGAADLPLPMARTLRHRLHPTRRILKQSTIHNNFEADVTDLVCSWMG